MSRPISSDELVRRYIREVSRRLPRRQRDDVARELESLIREALEEGAEGPDSRPDAGRTAALLREFGPPAAVALRYAPSPGYLIGPRAYPSFVQTLRYVLGGSLCLAALMAGLLASVGSVEGMSGVLALLVRLLVQFAFAGAALAVFVFAALERLAPDELPEPDAESWDPFSLPEVEETDEISPVEVSVKLYGLVLCLIWLNLFPDWVGFFLRLDADGIEFLSAADMGIQLPVVLISAWWGAAILKNVLLLRSGRRTRTIRWFECALSIAAVAVLGLLLDQVLSTVQTAGFRDSVGQTALAGIMSRVFPGVLAVILVVVCAGAVVRLYRLVRPELSPGSGAG